MLPRVNLFYRQTEMHQVPQAVCIFHIALAVFSGSAAAEDSPEVTRCGKPQHSEWETVGFPVFHIYLSLP